MVHLSPFRTVRALRLSAQLLAGLATLLFLSLLVQTQAGGAQAASPGSVYLPLVRGGATQPPPPGPVPGPATGALMFGDASFRSASIAVDKQDGMHVAFSRVAPFLPNEYPAVLYAYCSPGQIDCSKSANWRLVEVDTASEGWSWVQLRLTADGRPRLLLMRSIGRDGAPFGGMLYRYAECNANCASAQNWLSIDVTDRASGGGLYDTDYSYQTFALDNQGRPRFVYEDRANSAGEHAGAYYVFCNSNCTEQGTWFETRLDASGDNVYVDEHAVLLFTPDGRPRLFARDGGTFADPSSKLVYVECNADCDHSANWSLPVRLLSTGSGSGIYTWSAAATGSDGMRVSFYPRGGPFFYIWCNSGCADGAGWEGYSLELDNSSGDYSALALDRQGRPRVAFREKGSYSLGYLWCSADCESLNARWDSVMAEASSQIGAGHPIRPLPTCIEGSWFGGLRPTLALDSRDNPRIGYDAEYMMRCYINPDDPANSGTYIETKWWTSRFVFFPHP